MKNEIILFLSWAKTLFYFYILRDFRNWNHEQITFVEKSFTAKNKRDAKLMKTVLDFNKKKLR